MYFLSFFKSLFRPRKILCSLYFIANMFIIFIVFAAFASFGQSNPDDSSAISAGFIGIAVNFAIMAIALSPLGEAYVRSKEKARKLVRDATTEPLFQIFDEVYAEAKRVSSNVGDKIQLYYQDTAVPNAAALGHRTVIVTAGLLSLPPDQIKGVLAHEFGHIASGDSDLKLGISVSNFLLLLFTIITGLIIALIGLIVSYVSEGTAKVISVVGIAITSGVYALWGKMGMLLVNATSRKDEYAADAFAVDCGYGCELYDALDTLDTVKTKSSFLSLLTSTHPDTVDRLAAIKAKMGV